jgi:tetratricopeptide (TPR) repeat protein
MSRDPSARYASADELATEVRRWLADEPVTAYREPWTARAARWARRHRTAVAAGVVALLTAVVALSIGTALIWREKDRTAAQKEAADRERDRAEGEWRRAEGERAHAHQQRERAERNFTTARTLAFDVSGLVGIMETGLANPQQTDRNRLAVLNASRGTFDRFRAELPDDIPIQKQAAALHRYAGNISRLLTEFTAAEKAYDASIRIWQELADRFPDDAGYRDNLSQTLRDFAAFQKRTGKLRDAAATAGRATELAEGLKGQVHEVAYQRTLGTALVDRASVEYVRGEFATAEASARRALGLLDALQTAPRDRANPVDPLLAAIAVNDLATALRGQGRTDEAIKAHDDAVGRLEALGGAKGGRDVRHYYHRLRVERAVTWGQTADRRGAAVDDLGGVIEGAEKLIAEYPSVAAYKEVLAAACLRCGDLQRVLGQLGPAEADLNKALTITRELVDRYGQLPDHVALRGQAYLALGRAEAAAGKPAEAAGRFANAVGVLQVARRKSPDDHHIRRGLEEAEREARANPKPAKP